MKRIFYLVFLILYSLVPVFGQVGPKIPAIKNGNNAAQSKIVLLDSLNNYRLDSLRGLKKLNFFDSLSFDEIDTENFKQVKNPKQYLNSFSEINDSKFFSRFFDDPISGNEFLKEIESELPTLNSIDKSFLASNTDKSIISKRIVSLKDRDIIDSVRSVVADKAYRIKDEVQDSLSLYLVSEKEKLKESLFFEGLVDVERFNDSYSVTDFSTSLGVKLNKFYEIGAGPEIGLNGNDFSNIGARIFARRNLFNNKAFAIVENSVKNYPNFSNELNSLKGLTSNFKLGAGKLFNLSNSGLTKLNVQTLFNPDFLRNNYGNLIDFRFGISKLTFK